MKRSEIEAGKEYYYDRSTKWAASHGTGLKATVVDTDRYRRVTEAWFRGDPYRKDPKGAAVLVDLHHAHWAGGGERIVREAVSPIHLRGPYEEVKAQLDADREKFAALNEKLREQYVAARTKTMLAAEAAAHIGVTALYQNGESVNVRTDQFAAMVSALAGYGWTYTKDNS